MATEFYAPLVSGTGAFQRKWGTSTSVVEPYITGYHFVRFDSIPQGAAVALTNLYGESLDTISMCNVLSSTVIAVTLPSSVINRASIEGLGGIKATLPTSVEVDNTFSIRFLEVSGVPIFKIISAWCRSIRDTIYGIAPEGSSKGSYSGSVYYWTTRPDGVIVEFACCLTGVYPTKSPYDQYGHDLSQIDKLEVEVEFAFDYLFTESWVYANCAKLASDYKIAAVGQ